MSHVFRGSCARARTYKDLADRLRRRFTWAEGQTKRDRPPEKKITWIKARCPKCGEPVLYSPKENWDGRLTCPQCQHDFRITLLDHFVVNPEEEEV